MSDLLTPQLNGQSAAPDWLQARRLAGQAGWNNCKLPTRRSEQWKYTSLLPLEQEFTAAPVTGIDATELALPDLGGNRLVFVNGHWCEKLSALQADPALELVRFSMADAAQSALIARHLGTALDDSDHLFTLLNDAALTEGVLLRVRPKCKAQQPVQLVWHNSGGQQPFITNQRLLVLAEAHSEVTLVEHFSGSANAFSNGISEIFLSAGAQLNHSRLHLETDQAMHIGGLHARLDRDSTLKSFHLALGGKLKRIDIVINHQESGAHCQLDGIYLLNNQEHIDYHSTIEHIAPRCTTDENFRGIVGDRARAVFNGRIHIHPHAQQTRAELNNRNLLTSATAEVNTKPELEIYADDVQCAHGATVAQLDDVMLHYLKTRGIPADEALRLLSYGFINTLLESQTSHDLQSHLRQCLENYFDTPGTPQSGSEGITQAGHRHGGGK